MGDNTSLDDRKRPEAALESDEDYGDSFLTELSRGELPFRAPVPGERLGGEDGRRFEIIAELGKGAMGQVFRARDEKLQRVVALKFLLPQPEYPLMALGEAQAIARLAHENIVAIFDTSEWVGKPWEPRVPFLVMECLEGESLATVLRREQRLSVRRAMQILNGVVAGLAHAHERQLVHRDLKPSNVFITWKGQVKVFDFGLSQLGTTHVIGVPIPRAGTPAYMAPEQWRGEPQDARTDIWAVGVLLYEMLTGRLPYPDITQEDFRARVLSSESMPSVREHCPDLPWEIESLLNKALAKEPARRFSSALELRERLRDIEERLGPWHEAPLPPVDHQRRQVTLVSCRLAGLGGLVVHLDAEGFSELEAAFHQGCAGIIHRDGGSITHFVGDEVLACFGCALAREYDSERAVHAGLRLTQELGDTLHRALPHLPPGTLSVQVGIHTDLVTLETGHSVRQGMAPPLLGEAPRLATWLARQAPSNTVLLSDTTWTLVRSTFQTEALGAQDFQGTRGNTRIFVHRLVREKPFPFRFDRALVSGGLSTLVGRDRELGTLLSLWERTTQGHGALVLIRGEAGLGKSRLIQELYERVPPLSSFRARGQCWSQFSHSALHPLVEQFQRFFHPSPGGGAPRQPPELEAFLARHGVSPEHLPPLAALLQATPQEPSADAAAPEQLKQRIFEALVAFLAQLARERPVLLTLEDLHWADHSTLQLIGLLAERLAPMRLLLLLSARPEFNPTWPRTAWTHQLTLERLPAEHTAALVKELSQERVLPAEVIQYLVRETDGVPLFIEELTRMVLDRVPSGSGAGFPAPGTIPVTLHELLLARLDELPRRQKALAQLCAVIGRDFTHAQLSAISRLGDETLKQDISGLLEAGVLHLHRDASEPGYQFRHALLQEAALQSLPRSTRRQHHQRIARVLEARFPETAQVRPELLAHHYTEAGELERAIHYGSRAGERASQRSANVEAVTHLTQALRLLRSLPDASSRGEEELQLLTALGVPLAQVQRYRTPELAQLHERATELFLQVQEEHQLRLSHWGLFHYYFARAEFGPALRLAEQLVDSARRQRNQELLILGYRMKATLCSTWGHLPTALEHVEHVLACSHFTLEQYQALAVKHWVDPRTMALVYGAIILSVMGDAARAEAYSQEALELTGRIAHPHTRAYALTHLALACILRREPQRALEWANACIALSREHRFRLWLGWSTVLRSYSLVVLGRRREGMLLMQRSLEQIKDSGIRLGMPTNLAMLADAHLGQGQAGEALERIREALSVVKATGERGYEAEIHRLHGESLRALGREAGALRCFLRALAVARAQQAGTFQVRAGVSLGRLLQHQGRADVAREKLKRILRRFDARLDSVDLQEARALLTQLPPEPAAPDLKPGAAPG